MADDLLAYAPDLAGVVVGWRCWRLGKNSLGKNSGDWNSGDWRLLSMTRDTLWIPRAVLVGQCPIGPHIPADPQCTCGIYAARDIQTASEYLTTSTGTVSLFGCVALWGNVLEATHGWRASHAYPLLLFASPEATAQDRRELAQCYGVPVHSSLGPFKAPEFVQAAETLRHHLELARSGLPAASEEGTVNALIVNLIEVAWKEHRRHQEKERRRKEERERQLRYETERRWREEKERERIQLRREVVALVLTKSASIGACIGTFMYFGSVTVSIIVGGVVMAVLLWIFVDILGI